MSNQTRWKLAVGFPHRPPGGAAKLIDLVGAGSPVIGGLSGETVFKFVFNSEQLALHAKQRVRSEYPDAHCEIEPFDPHPHLS